MSSAGRPSPGDRRRLAFVYHPRSFSPFALAQAAREVCALTWVVDSGMADHDAMARLLPRMGHVVDVAGMSVEEAATSVAADGPDGILALADSSLHWAARVAQRLGLPSLTPEAALRLSDKYRQRTALRAAGLPGPGFWRVPGPADDAGWRALAATVTFPAVLKPRRGESSRDVVSVSSLGELRAMFADGSGARRLDAEDMLLEEYLPGRSSERGDEFADYVSVESLVSAGRVSYLAITGRFPVASPFRETGFFIPSALGRDDREAVLALAGEAIGALGVTLGFQHTEIRLTPDGPRVIEVNGRVGGGVQEMLGAVNGIDPLALAMRIALGEAIAFDELLPCTGIGYRLLWQPPESMRRIVAVEGLERLRADPEVAEVNLRRRPGDSVDWREGNWEHVFSVLGTVRDHDRLKLLERRIHSETRVTGE